MVSLHLMSVLLLLLGVLEAFAASYLHPAVLPPFDGGDDDDSMFGDGPNAEFPVEKKEMMNKVIAALLHVNPEQMMSYVEDNVQDPYVKKAIMTKKVNVCHFKLCNLGRRRRR